MHHPPPLCRQISINPCLHNELACKHLLLLLLLEIQSEKKIVLPPFMFRYIIIENSYTTGKNFEFPMPGQQCKTIAIQYIGILLMHVRTIFFISDSTYCNLRAFFLLQHPMFMLLDKSISIVGCYFEISKCSIVILFKKEKNGFCQRHDSPEFSLYEFSHHVVQQLVKAFLPSRWLSRFVVLVGFEFKRWLLLAHLVYP